MAIFITGDLHGDFSRFKKEIFYGQTELAKDDHVIVTGGFGGVWDGSPNERHWLDWLDAIGRGMFQSDPLTGFLEEVAQRCRFRHWFFGALPHGWTCGRTVYLPVSGVAPD